MNLKYLLLSVTFIQLFNELLCILKVTLKFLLSW